MTDANFSTIPGLTLLGRGKVRDIYDLGDRLLLVASDRLSAFDVVLPDPIPDKGKVLTQISAYWFERTKDIILNHLLATDLRDFPPRLQAYGQALEGRSMLVRKCRPLPVEAIVRGYLSGSAWQDYQRTNTVSGCPLPPGLQESQELPQPIFTPSTKAAQGQHDESITLAEAEKLLGTDMARQVAEMSLALYERGRTLARQAGIIIADTKFEFGLLDDKLLLIDEVMTPDSSRFWPADEYEPGRPQNSYDKQYVRDYLERINFNKKPPAPHLPPEVIEGTRARYAEALTRLTGKGI